jgi:hypothetical protein
MFPIDDVPQLMLLMLRAFSRRILMTRALAAEIVKPCGDPRTPHYTGCACGTRGARKSLSSTEVESSKSQCRSSERG